MHCNAKAALWTARQSFLTVLAKFILRMRRNSYFRASGQYYNPSRRIRRSDFLCGTDILAIGGHLPCDLDFSPFDLKQLSHVTCCGIIFPKFELGQPIDALSWYVMSCSDIHFLSSQPCCTACTMLSLVTHLANIPTTELVEPVLERETIH